MSLYSPIIRCLSKRYELDNYEADDIIGTLSKEADKAGFQTIIITGDRVTELPTDNVTIYYTKKVLLMLIIIRLTLLRKNTTG
ncbi:hypothetical protein ACVPOQ_01775 [Staphylococcus aureus]